MSLTTVYSGGEPAFEDTTDSSFPFNVTVPLCHKATESFLLSPWTVPAFVAAWPSQLQRVRATPCCGARAPGLASLWSWGSPALGCRLSGCGPWAPLWPMGSSTPWQVGSSQLRARTRASRIGRQILYNAELLEEPHGRLNQIFTDSSMRLKGLWC